MLATFARWAERLYPWRWRFGLVTLCVFVAVSVSGALGYSGLDHALWLISGPAISVSWGLMLLAVWFHPSKGALVPIERMGLRRTMRAVARAYAGGFLVLWFAFGVICWPIFVAGWVRK